jgi:alkylation response protein AidB-like acyl-CoA dehydrogenase
MVGPVIYTFGTLRERERFLPPILSGDDRWWQGYSEPGASAKVQVGEAVKFIGQTNPWRYGDE